MLGWKTDQEKKIKAIKMKQSNKINQEMSKIIPYVDNFKKEKIAMVGHSEHSEKASMKRDF